MKQIDQKKRKATLREKSVKWLAGFFAVMLLLTVLSRAVSAMTVPVIQTGYIKKSTIDRTIRASGRIVQNRDRAVYTIGGLRVGTVFVREGQSVAAGDALFELDFDALGKKIQETEQEYQRLELALGDLESGESLEAQEREKARKRADEDYKKASERTGREVEDAKEAMEQAEQKLEDFLAQDPLASEGEDTVRTELENRCREKEADWNQAAEAQAELEREIQAAVDADKEKEMQIRQSYESKVSAATAKVESCEQEKARADAALEDYLAKLDSESASDRSTQEEILRSAYEEKKQAYETALQNRQDSMTNASRNREDANGPKRADSSKKTAQMTLSEKAEELNQLKALQQQAGKICSPVDGLISSVLVTTGEFTTEGTAVLMADLTEGGRFQTTVTKEQEAYLSRGDAVTLKGSGVDSYEAVIDTIQPDKENTNSFVVTVQVPEGTLEIGTIATMTAVRQSEPYSVCVPLSALHRDGNEDYVLVIQEKNTVLGTEWIAERIPVTIQDQNETLAALAPGALTEDQKVIMSSNKEVNGGDRVRLEDS